MKEGFNQPPATPTGQLEQLSGELREFVDAFATELSFENFAKLNEMARRADLYRQCLEKDDWKPVIKELMDESVVLLDYLRGIKIWQQTLGR